MAANVENARETVRGILEGKTCEGGRGTAYALIQGATEYLDHYRGTRGSDAHFKRQLLAANPLKVKAVELVRQIAAMS